MLSPSPARGLRARRCECRSRLVLLCLCENFNRAGAKSRARAGNTHTAHTRSGGRRGPPAPPVPRLLAPRKVGQLHLQPAADALHELAEVDRQGVESRQDAVRKHRLTRRPLAGLEPRREVGASVARLWRPPLDAVAAALRPAARGCRSEPLDLCHCLRIHPVVDNRPAVANEMRRRHTTEARQVKLVDPLEGHAEEAGAGRKRVHACTASA